MKPDWKDAPDFARWLCQDSNGRWVWFEFKPKPNMARFEWIHGRNVGNWQYVEFPNWCSTLERRP